jgi:predicted Zn-dependent peptidase
MQIARYTLHNGLRLMVLELPHVHSVELGLFVKAGPRFETPDDLGLSHFTEHMLFRGTRSLPGTFGLHAEVERLGSPIQALTSRDYCQYYFSMPPRHLERASELFAEIMMNPSFEDIEVERRIVLEEFLGDLNEDNEDINLENHSRAMLWPGSTLGRNILGTEDNIRRFSRADLFRHHSRYYTASNSLLYFAGAVTLEQAKALALRFFDRLPQGEMLPDNEVRATVHGPQIKFIDHVDSQDHLNLGFVAPAYTAENYPAMVALHNILVEGISSRLQWNLCERLGMVYDLDAGMESFFDTGVFDIDTSAGHGKLVSLVREVLAILQDLRRTPVDARELERAKERYRMVNEFALDNPNYLASWLAGNELYRPTLSPHQHIARMERLTAEELQETARAVFQPAHLALVIVGRQSRTERKQLLKLIDGEWAR